MRHNTAFFAIFEDLIKTLLEMKNWVAKIVLPCIVIIGITACDKGPDRIPCDGSTQSWDGNVANIVATGCTGSTCHGAGSINGDFTAYAGIKPFLDNGSFENAVLIDRTMPQVGTLADSSLAHLQCWFEQGYTEN